jgi:hypothetical protein
MPQFSEEQVRQIIKEELEQILIGEKFVFSKPIQIMDGRNIVMGKTTGTKFGTETGQKIGFYNKTPVVQGSTISDPSGQATDLDAEARTAINALIDRLQDIGIIA